MTRRWRARRGAALALALSASSPALAQAPAPYTFPPKIGIAQLTNVEDFEAKQPGQGQVGRYAFQGWTMSMFVYDARRTDLPDGPDAAKSVPELTLAVAGVLELQKRGQFARVDEGTGFAMPPMGRPPVFHCKALIIHPAAQPGGATASPFERYICLTTSRKRFVKVFVSSTTPPGDQATVFTPVAAVLELTARMLQR